MASWSILKHLEGLVFNSWRLSSLWSLWSILSILRSSSRSRLARSRTWSKFDLTLAKVLGGFLLLLLLLLLFVVLPGGQLLLVLLLVVYRCQVAWWMNGMNSRFFLFLFAAHLCGCFGKGPKPNRNVQVIIDCRNLLLLIQLLPVFHFFFNGRIRKYFSFRNQFVT